VYLVRHACAGDKRKWSGPDAERPLDQAGVAQAAALTDELARVPVHRILTSPARRCVQTVEPLADRLGLPVESIDALLPNGDSDDVMRLAVALDATAAVICTHGEVMRPLLADLRRAGTTITAKQDDDDWLLQKGTGWALTLDATGAIAAIDHVAPHVVHSCPLHDPPRR
jgi:phosphohistidine phosphatase SixA